MRPSNSTGGSGEAYQRQPVRRLLDGRPYLHCLRVDLSTSVMSAARETEGVPTEESANSNNECEGPLWRLKQRRLQDKSQISVISLPTTGAWPTLFLALSSPERRAVAHLPTGAGKTRIAAHTACYLLNEKDTEGDSLVIWLAATEELCDQAADQLLDAWTYLGRREVICIHRHWGTRSLESTEPAHPGS